MAVMDLSDGRGVGAVHSHLRRCILDGSLPVEIFESSEGYALSAVLMDRDFGHAFLADSPATGPAFVRVFNDAAGTFTAGQTIKTEPAHKLPPRALVWF